MSFNQMELKLEVEPGLAHRFSSMRECFATCIHSRPEKNCVIAGELDVQPSNLSAMLSGARNLDPEIIERYMQRFDDPTPALYWASRYCQDVASQRQAALAQIPGLVMQLQKLMEQAGQ